MFYKYGAAVLSFHKNNLVLALTHLYPEIGPFDKSRFLPFWAREKARRQFFDKITKEI